jgi:hypothetical protein
VLAGAQLSDAKEVLTFGYQIFSRGRGIVCADRAERGLVRVEARLPGIFGRNREVVLSANREERIAVKVVGKEFERVGAKE